MTELDLWEALWAPYDDATYQTALSFIQPDDIILDIGAGDLRFSRQMAKIARQVYAIEQQPALLTQRLRAIKNLTIICADARIIPWPAGITTAVLLMRHCTHFDQYVARLRAVGCRRLVTNARWGMDIELMDLGPRLPWEHMTSGWYACSCGQTGLVESDKIEALTEADIWHVTQVEYCPGCAG
jgi:hypothetical protein